MRLEPALQLFRWKDLQRDELYGRIGGNTGNVYLDIFPEETDLSDDCNGVLCASIGLGVRHKWRKAYRDEFGSFPTEYWSGMLGMAGKAPEVDNQRCTIFFEDRWTGELPELMDEIATLFCRFLATFRPFMVEPERRDESVG